MTKLLPVIDPAAAIERLDRLGGLIHEYRRAASADPRTVARVSLARGRSAWPATGETWRRW
jgi:hypothetical protein